MTKVDVNPTHPRWPQVLDSAISGLRAVGKGFRAALQALQTARMMQALSQLGDEQLAQIGIERRDIPSYAERLITAVELGENNRPSSRKTRIDA